MTADDDHRDLVRAWVPLRDALRELPDRLEWPNDTTYYELVEKAERVRALGSHLEGALELSQTHRYGSALALMRTGLEQVVVDWLMFQGRTVVQRVRASEADWTRWQAEMAEGAEWTKNIVSWKRTRGGVRIVRTGLHNGDSTADTLGAADTLSIYYFLLDQYQPTIGRPEDQDDDGLVNHQQLQSLARENAAIWQVYLTWSALLENLSENRLVDEADKGRLQVHYRFLSGFAHPVANQSQVIGRSGGPSRQCDHYASELVLLYAIRLAELELEHYLRPLENRPGVAVSRMPALNSAITTAHNSSRYFWFLGQEPHPYDVWKAANVDVFRTMRSSGSSAQANTIDDVEVSYPSDPLGRLIKMHSSTTETMSGLSYSSPWHRTDAAFR